MDKKFFINQIAGQKEIKTALTITIISVISCLFFVSFAKIPLLKIVAFIPCYESVLIINNLITATLLYSQFRFLRLPSLYILSCGYLFLTFIELIHMLTYPEIFSKNGLLNAGTQTTAWLYMFWHGIFPLFVIGFSYFKKFDKNKLFKFYLKKRYIVILGFSCTLILVFIFTLIAILGQNIIPVIIVNHHYTPLMIYVVSTIWLISFTTIIYLIYNRPYTVLDVWLIITMVSWILDISLSSVFNGARYDLGYYSGRIYGLISSCILLIILLLENSVLYKRLFDVYENEKKEKINAINKSNELNELYKELESFSFSISHDLTAPLNAMEGYIKVLNEELLPKINENEKKYIEKIYNNLKYMKTLIKDILNFSKLGKEKISADKIDIDSILINIIEEFKVQYNNRKIEFIIKELGPMKAEATLIRQVFFNLINNAIKFTKNKSPAIIEIGYQFNSIDKNLKIYYIKDNGIGFDMQFANKLFGVFQRLHSHDEYEGTGIGLSIVKKIIERHGGKIWVNSEINVGTTFYFTIEKSSIDIF